MLISLIFFLRFTLENCRNYNYLSLFVYQDKQRRHLYLNTYNAAGVSRRQDQNVKKKGNNFNIQEFGYLIWNPYENCIQKSPNMPGIGSLIRENRL